MGKKNVSQKTQVGRIPVLLIVIIVIVILLVGGVSILSTYKANNEGYMQVVNAKWPSDLPENIPPLTAGKIIGVTKGNNGSAFWYILIDDVNESQMADYKKQLNESGWTTYSEVTFPATMTYLSKGNHKITIGYNQSPTEVDVQMTISHK